MVGASSGVHTITGRQGAFASSMPAMETTSAGRRRREARSRARPAERAVRRDTAVRVRRSVEPAGHSALLASRRRARRRRPAAPPRLARDHRLRRARSGLRCRASPCRRPCGSSHAAPEDAARAARRARSEVVAATRKKRRRAGFTDPAYDGIDLSRDATPEHIPGAPAGEPGNPARKSLDFTPKTRSSCAGAPVGPARVLRSADRVTTRSAA